MASHLLMISLQAQDVEFGKELAKRNGYSFSHALGKDDVRRLLVTHPASLVFWDAENTAQYEGVMEILPKYARAQRVFAITDKSLFVYPHLYKRPIFGHYLYRRFDPAALSVYSRLCVAALEKEPMGLARYLPEGAPVKEIVLSRSSHKRAAIEAMQSALTRQGVRGRIAGLVAQAADELILNAIFDAPMIEGKYVRKSQSRDSDVQLGEKEKVRVEIGYGPEYMGICVSDQFGSLSRRAVIDSLRAHLEKEGSASTKVELNQLGLGLHGIVKSGLSLIFISKPRSCTQMILLFPEVDSVKEFRTGFRFLSLLAD